MARQVDLAAVAITCAVAMLGEPGHAIREDAAFEQLHPREPPGSPAGGRFAIKDQEKSKRNATYTRAAATRKRAARARKRARARKPSLRNIKGREMEWGQRLAVAHMQGDDATIARFKKLTGIRKKADRVRWAVGAVAPKLLGVRVENPENLAVQESLLAIALVPSGVLAQLKAHGTRVAVGTRGLHTYPEMAPYLDRPTHDGRGWQETPGVFDPLSNTVIVNATARNPQMMLHEVAHAFDMKAANISDDPTLVALWRAYGPQMGGYFYDAALPVESRREFVAEMLAQLWARRWDITPPAIADYFVARGYAPAKPRPKRKPKRPRRTREASLERTALAVAGGMREAIVKVPTKSGNPLHDTETGRFASRAAVAARFFDTKTDRELPVEAIPAGLKTGPRADLSYDLTEPDALAAVFDGFTHKPTGLHVEVIKQERRTDRTGSTTAIRARILDKEGHIKGSLMRAIRRTGDAVIADNDLLQVNGEYRGNGFASALNQHAEEAYREAGIPAVSLTTGLADGGFVWAIAGFLVRPGSLRSMAADEDLSLSHEERTEAWAIEMIMKVTDSTDGLDLRSGQLAALVRKHPHLAAVVDELEERLFDGTFELPYQLAMFGHDQPFPGRDGPTWLGKWILADSHKENTSAQWHGVKYL